MIYIKHLVGVILLQHTLSLRRQKINRLHRDATHRTEASDKNMNRYAFIKEVQLMKADKNPDFINQPLAYTDWIESQRYCATKVLTLFARIPTCSPITF